MDWAELAKQLEAGAKIYKGFEAGEHIASQMASAERSMQELHTQYEALSAQVAQATQALAAVKDKAAQLAADAATRVAQQQQVSDAAQAQRIQAAAAELDEWHKKIALQAQAYATATHDGEATLSRLEAAQNQLHVDIAALQRIKDALKSQLQTVA